PSPVLRSLLFSRTRRPHTSPLFPYTTLFRSWVSFHHGGGVGIGYAQHAGVVIVCDGTDAAAKRIARVLWNDPASGVMRHADAGYAKAIDVAKAKKLDLPMLGR